MKLDRLISIIESLEEITDKDAIAKTEQRLKSMNFDPNFLFPISHFLIISKEEMIKEAHRISSIRKEEMPEVSDASKLSMLKEKQFSMMAYWFSRLILLRMDIPEAWDEINELYEDD